MLGTFRELSAFRELKTSRTIGRLIVGASLASLMMGCSDLTSPPSPEPIASETPANAASARPAPSAAPAASAAPSPRPSASAAPSAPIDPNAKLISTDTAVGKGPAAKSGDTVSVHYVGTLPDGKEFDSSRKRSQPFVFTLGQGRVIKGWDQGVVGMKVGGKRKLVIPPVLGYGERGAPPVIPGGATLNFEIELLEIKKQP